MTPVEPEVPEGRFVEIASTLLPAGRRAPGVPGDTAACPLTMRVRGFLSADARLGAEVTILTMAGRHVTGTLSDAEPRHIHDFGRIDPALLNITVELSGAKP